MSSQNPAAASDPHPFAIRSPSNEGSVCGPSVRTCHIVHGQSQACGGLVAACRQTAEQEGLVTSYLPI
eukprot:364760-Chlamydomonas_euryale.AAC.9